MTTNTQTYEIDTEDVEYNHHAKKPLLARLFKPRGTGPFPVVVELHGGAWVSGNRTNEDASNEALATRGVIVVALDFRVPPEAPYPASLSDIHYGIRWCKTHASEWNGRNDRIGAMGTSSGAHQAMLLGMRPRDPRYSALSSPDNSTAVDGTLSCVILCSPVIDPLGRYHYVKGLRQDCSPPPGMAQRVIPMHDQYWQSEEAMDEGAPARILRRGENTSLPPTLLLARRSEDSHPTPDREEFINQYRNAGGRVDVTIFDGTNEGLFGDLSSDVASQALDQMTSFIYEHIG